MTSTHLNYKEKMFLMETRLYQLAELRKTVVRSQCMSEFGEVLDEMKNMLVHFKLKIWNEEPYVSVPCYPPTYVYERDLNPDIVYNMMYTFLQIIVREFDMSVYFDTQSAQEINRIAFPDPSISGYERYLQITVSEPVFWKWKMTRNQLFVPNHLFQIAKEPNAVSKEVCGICLESHKNIDTLVCDCLHEFGHACFQTWAANCQKNASELTCPICRKEVHRITRYSLPGCPIEESNPCSI